MQSYDELLTKLITDALQEDIGIGDHSTIGVIHPDATGRAVLKIKQSAILAGMHVAEKVFKQVEPSAVFTAFKKDGELVHSGEIAFEVTAKVHTILSCERLVLNCMQRMSGIATLTKKYTSLLEGYHTKILDTRKTTPNFRLLEKEAVRIGDGVNHRYALYDMIMLKDNHIDYCGGLEPAINKSYAYSQQLTTPLKIEVETRSIEDVKKVCAIGKGKIFRVMLDNFTPAMVGEAVQLIDGLFEIEASGGIDLNNIQNYAATGVDYVSVGALIHQAQSIDLSLKAVLID